MKRLTKKAWMGGLCVVALLGWMCASVSATELKVEASSNDASIIVETTDIDDQAEIQIVGYTNTWTMGTGYDTGHDFWLCEGSIFIPGYVRLAIDTSGNVGIGTDSPSTLLHVASSSGATASVISGTSSVSTINLGDTDDLDIGKICYANSTNKMYFSANNIPVLDLNNSGCIVAYQTVRPNSINIDLGTSSNYFDDGFFDTIYFQERSTEPSAPPAGSDGMIYASCNEVFAYVPSERVLAEGGYEASGAMTYFGFHGPFQAGVEDRVVDLVKKLMER